MQLLLESPRRGTLTADRLEYRLVSMRNMLLEHLQPLHLPTTRHTDKCQHWSTLAQLLESASLIGCLGTLGHSGLPKHPRKGPAEALGTMPWCSCVDDHLNGDAFLTSLESTLGNTTEAKVHAFLFQQPPEAQPLMRAAGINPDQAADLSRQGKQMAATYAEQVSC